MYKVYNREQTPQTFCQKLKWKTNNDSFKEVTFLRLDCYLFKFDEPLTKEIQYALFDYMETLDFYKGSSIVKTAIWLYQHSVKFKLKFSWNKILPVHYNIKQMSKPRRLDKRLKERMTEVMSFDLNSSSD